jgi:hypothetical protein
MLLNLFPFAVADIEAFMELDEHIWFWHKFQQLELRNPDRLDDRLPLEDRAGVVRVSFHEDIQNYRVDLFFIGSHRDPF